MRYLYIQFDPSDGILACTAVRPWNFLGNWDMSVSLRDACKVVRHLYHNLRRDDLPLSLFAYLAILCAPMQGNFQMEVVNGVGHLLHEDDHPHVASLLDFWRRNDRIRLPPKIKSVGEV